MKILALLLFLVSCSHPGRTINSSIPPETIKRLQTLYPDQSESFILERLQNASNAFQKWRGFPPYYYELIDRMDVFSSSKPRRGLCAGDAHLENFGFLYMYTPHFSLNDLDDVAPCSLDADAMRLFIGQRLVTSISASEFLKAYEGGLGGMNAVLPAYLEKLRKDSSKDGMKMTKKYKKLLETSVCEDDFAPVSDSERKLLDAFMKRERKKALLFCSRTKDSGGSAGSKRFVVIFEGLKGPEVFELKPLLNPAPLYKKNLSLMEREQLYLTAVSVFFQEHFKAYYYPVILDDKLYQRRPVWKGNAEIKEDEMSSGDLKQVMLYEARVLGLYHRITNNGRVSHSAQEWEKKAQMIEKQWRAEMGE